jgi:DNA polymerase sigma
MITDQVYRKLSNEIMQFRYDVREILSEVHPIKNEIINQLSQIIGKNLPTVGIDVYGSHATQLCLHWSDIDLVVIPQNMGGPGGIHNNSHHYGSHQNGHGGMRNY